MAGDFAEILRAKVQLNASRAEARRAVLRGMSAQYPYDRLWKTPIFKLLIFSSSTFTDTGLERDFLMDKLLFELRDISRQHGIQCIIIDMRWGVRDENSQDHKTWTVVCTRSQLVQAGIDGYIFPIVAVREVRIHTSAQVYSSNGSRSPYGHDLYPRRCETTDFRVVST